MHNLYISFTLIISYYSFFICTISLCFIHVYFSLLL
nr:MAG TPA: hypothetical protein [Bacteriophage sp.]